MSKGTYPVKREYFRLPPRVGAKATAQHDFTTYATLVLLYLIAWLLE